jgi:hypothetical protein
MKLLKSGSTASKCIRPASCSKVTRRAGCNGVGSRKPEVLFEASFVKALGSVSSGDLKCQSALTLWSEGGNALATSHRIRYIFVVPEYVTNFGQVLKVTGQMLRVFQFCIAI